MKTTSNLLTKTSLVIAAVVMTASPAIAEDENQQKSASAAQGTTTATTQEFLDRLSIGYFGAGYGLRTEKGDVSDREQDTREARVYHSLKAKYEINDQVTGFVQGRFDSFTGYLADQPESESEQSNVGETSDLNSRIGADIGQVYSQGSFDLGLNGYLQLPKLSGGNDGFRLAPTLGQSINYGFGTSAWSFSATLYERGPYIYANERSGKQAANFYALPDFSYKVNNAFSMEFFAEANYEPVWEEDFFDGTLNFRAMIGPSIDFDVYKGINLMPFAGRNFSNETWFGEVWLTASLF